MTIKGHGYLRSDNTGVLTVYRWSEARDAPGTDWSGTDGLEAVEACPYRRLTVKARDLERAAEGGFTVERRARVKLSPAIAHALSQHEHDLHVHEGGKLWLVTDADTDATHAFLDLAEVQSDGWVELVATTVTYDAMGVPTPAEDRTRVPYRAVSEASRADGGAGDDSDRAYDVVDVRPCDYAGQPYCRHDGRLLRVEQTAKSSPRWLRLTLRERGGDAWEE